jgi:dCTP deaminase
MLSAQSNFEGIEPGGGYGVAREPGLLDLSNKPGLFARQQIRVMIQRQMIDAIADIEEAQLQPASLDLRLGSRAFRIRASFLPGRDKKVRDQLEDLQYDEISLVEGAVLERHCVYLVELQEFVKLQPSISGIANPKSSTGRLDVFIRLIADNAEVFDTVEGGYAGPLYAEISPRSFSIKVRKGSRLNQIRFRRRNSQQTSYEPILLGDRELRDLHRESMRVD